MSNPPRGVPSLMERIDALHEELDALIDARAAEMKKAAPGVPTEVLRAMITNKGGGCRCRTFRAMRDE